MISFDPLVAHHSAAENATGDMDQVVREFARIANLTESDIEIVHHTRKPAQGQEEYSIYDSRGAGAIINVVRSARVLNPMSRTEAQQAHLDAVEQKFHFRIDKPKANMAPPTAASWYRFASIELPNGDNVGIVTPWLYPGQDAAPTPELAAHQRAADNMFLVLLDKMTERGQRASPAKNSPYYAPKVFAGQKEAKANKLNLAMLEGAMERLLDAERIRIEDRGAKNHEVKVLVRGTEHVRDI